jgi:glycosyltransferase involved in cell wall biosynthesis
MRLLIITYSFFPDLTPRAFRWKAVAEQLQIHGHEVHVLCAVPGPDIALDGVTVHRVADRLMRGFTRATPSDAGLPRVGSSGLIGYLKKTLRQIARTLWRFFYWPDFACGWVVPAVKALRELRAKEQFDWIISSSHPFSGHLIALLGRGAEVKTRWLVDISDPYCLMPQPSPYNRLLYGWLSRWVEGKVIATADVLSMTTDSTAQMYESAFPGCQNKTRVIGPLMSLPVTPPRARQPDGLLRLVYIGTLYRQLRSPTFLLACAAALKHAYPDMPLEVHFYGSLNDCGDQLASYTDVAAPFVFAHGLVDRDVVQQAMVDADVLVNIGNNSEAQLASKVVEYMTVGRPILNIISIEKDTSVTALEDYPAVLNITRHEGSPSAELVERLHCFLTDRPAVDAQIPRLVRDRYSPANITRQYESILGIDSSRDSA